jgi:hypothetical protein
LLYLKPDYSPDEWSKEEALRRRRVSRENKLKQEMDLAK